MKTVNIPFSFGQVFKGLISAVLVSIMGVGLIAWGTSFAPDSEAKDWVVMIGMLCFMAAYIIPTSLALNVSGRLGFDESRVTIKHPHLWLIAIVNIFFGLTLIGWFFSLFWASSPGNVVVPNEAEI